MTTAQDLIARLDLSPHPEGGWYHETWRAPAPAGTRASATLIHFLLEAGQSSHWHTVDATEAWLWHAGDPLTLSLAENDAGPISRVRLGPDLAEGHGLQGIVPAGWWQAAAPEAGPHGYALVSCMVSPAFEFSGFRLAHPGWEPGA